MAVALGAEVAVAGTTVAVGGGLSLSEPPQPAVAIISVTPTVQSAKLRRAIPRLVCSPIARMLSLSSLFSAFLVPRRLRPQPNK